MTELPPPPAAFIGNYADIVTRKTRSVFVVSVEFPIEQYQAFVAAFGGPLPGAEIPVVLARLDPEKVKSERSTFHPFTEANVQSGIAGKPVVKRLYAEMSLTQQAGMRSQDVKFHRFLEHRLEEPDGSINNQTAAEAIRTICCVGSRADITDSNRSGQSWRDLDAEFVAWKHEVPIAEPMR